MMQGNTPPPIKWQDRTEKKTQDKKPRIVFSDHMVVFAASGIRNKLEPSLLYDDGFESPNHSIFVASAYDLRPENHDILKAQLQQAMEKAKRLKFSKTEQESLRRTFHRNVMREAVYDHPIAMIQHFAKTNPDIAAEFTSEDAMREVISEKASGCFSPHRLSDMIEEGFSNTADAMKEVKTVFKEQNMRSEYHKLELQEAYKIAEDVLRELRLPESTHQEVLKQCIKEKQLENGGRKLSFDTVAIEKIRADLIERNYANPDKIIESARAAIIRQAEKEGRASNPFDYTEEEKAKIVTINDIANEGISAKPVVMAGYADHNLTILMDNEMSDRAHGLSYAGMNLIRVDNKRMANELPGTLREELLHQGIDKIYRNQSRPYTGDNDNRKKLLLKAIADNIRNPHDLMCLGISRSLNYNIDSEMVLHREIPAKVMRFMDNTGENDLWSHLPRGQSTFDRLKAFVNQVIIKDAIAYNQGHPLQDIDDDYQRTPHYRKTAQSAKTLDGSRLQPPL